MNACSSGSAGWASTTPKALGPQEMQESTGCSPGCTQCWDGAQAQGLDVRDHLVVRTSHNLRGSLSPWPLSGPVSRVASRGCVLGVGQSSTEGWPEAAESAQTQRCGPAGNGPPRCAKDWGREKEGGAAPDFSIQYVCLSPERKKPCFVSFFLGHLIANKVITLNLNHMDSSFLVSLP